MDAAGLAIAAFNEVFVIGKFINQVLIDAGNQENDFQRLEFEFTHQQTLLATFGKRFLESRAIYEIDDCWKDQIKIILEELKRLVGEYGRLAARYDKGYAKKADDADKWWEVGARKSGKQLEVGEPKVISLELVDTPEQGNPGKSTRPSSGWSIWCLSRARSSKKFVRLEWALFNREKLEALVQDHSKLVGKLIEVMKLSLLTFDTFSSDISKLQEFQGKDAKTFGFSKITVTRMFILDHSQLEADATKLDLAMITSASNPLGPSGSKNNAAPLVGGGESGDLQSGKYGDQNILIEYKYYPSEESPESEITLGRIQFLSKLLGVAGRESQSTDSNNFTLHCLGYFQEPKENRYGLAFSVPPNCSPTFTSLHIAITSLRRESRPTLGQRFTIAHKIGYTLMEWFLVGWVHKGINSKNILFFRKEGEGEKASPDFNSPYLCGFEYARPDEAISGQVVEPRGPHWNLYRHPARQGLPTEAFKRIHDIYALGVLLLEIGLWQVAPDLFAGTNTSSLPPSAIKTNLVRNARERLGHFMGRKYRDAVLLCLESSLAVDVDDKRDSKLIAAFKEKVVDACEEGRALE